MSEDPPESIFKVVSSVCYHLVIGNASDLAFASFWLCPQRNIMTVSFGIDSVSWSSSGVQWQGESGRCRG